MSKRQNKIGLAVLAGVLSISSLLPVIPDKDNKHYRFSISNVKKLNCDYVPNPYGSRIVPNVGGNYLALDFDVSHSFEGYDFWGSYSPDFVLSHDDSLIDLWIGLENGDIINRRNQVFDSPVSYVFKKAGWDSLAHSFSKNINKTRIERD